MDKKWSVIPRFNLKLLVIVWSTVIVTTIASGLSLSFYIVNELEKQELKNISRDIVITAENIRAYTRDIENFSINMITSGSIQGRLKDLDSLEDVAYFKTLRELRKDLKYYVALRSSAVVDMYIIKGENEIIGDITKANKTEEQWYQDYLKRNLNRGFSTVIEAGTNLREGYSVENFRYVIDIMDINDSSNILGKLVLVLDYDFFVSTTMREAGQYASMILTDQNNQLMVYISEKESNAEQKVRKCTRIVSKEGIWIERENNYYIMESVKDQSWKIYGILDKEEMNQNLNPVRKILEILILGCLLISILIFTPIIYHTTKPLQSMIHGMQEVSLGNLETRIRIKTNDELTVMADTFNRMVVDIQHFLEESVEREKQANELRLKLFMAQINPHFICNTLNVIIYQAQKIHAKDIIEVTRAFINILQVTINLNHTAKSTILEEKKYIENYMLISRYRYSDFVKIRWIVDEELMTCKINRMLLQPLVENSMIHGIFPTGKKGLIQISMHREMQWIVISISDDGQGFTEERLQEMEKIMSCDKLEGRNNIGLQNVNLRLMLIYGKECKMQIKSKEGQGCEITFKIPYEKDNL